MRTTTRIDMHVHTRGSDGWGSPEAIRDAALAADIDGLCLTDHHLTMTKESVEVAACCREAGLLVFHGCEYSTEWGHLLVYGVNIAELKPSRYPPMQEIINRVTDAGGVAIPSHPYHGYKRMLGENVARLRRVRALEVANGQRAVLTPAVNQKALREARRRRLWGIGGSDAHDPTWVGLAYTEFQGIIETTHDLLRALKRGTFRAVTARTRVEEMRRSQIAKWKAAKIDTMHRLGLTDLDTVAKAGQFGGDGEHSSSGILH